MNLAIDSEEMEDTAGTRASAPGRQVAFPIVHDGAVALYQPPLPGSPVTDTAVLLASSWGFEEICTRKFFRAMAEEFAARGLASLRFDYPGTGDTADIPPSAWRAGCWLDSVKRHAQLLKKFSGCQRIILVGQGIGAALAYEASGAIQGLAGIALLAPVLDGRSYLRELSVWSRMSEPLTANIAEGHLVLGGEIIAKPLTDDLRGLKVKARNVYAPVFLAPREEQAAAAALCDELRAFGVSVYQRTFDEYQALVSNLTLQAIPQSLLSDLADWAEKLGARHVGSRTAAGQLSRHAVLHGEDFTETHLRFDSERLYGILCEPKTKMPGVGSVILLNASYERAAGWGRSFVTLSRDLARQGICSFRFDMANVGDSPPREGAPEQVLYTDSQQADVRAAIELMQKLSTGPIMVAGRCSGAYLAFRTLTGEKRLAGAVIGNAYTLQWDPRQDLHDLLRFVPQRLSSYTTKMFTIHTWRKILSGEVAVRQGLTNLSKQVFQKVISKLRPVLNRYGLTIGNADTVHAAVSSVLAREAALTFLYTEGDIGLDYFRRHFDIEENGVRGFSGARFRLIDNAEHNMLTPQAREIFRDEIITMTKTISARSPQTATSFVGQTTHGLERAS